MSEKQRKATGNAPGGFFDLWVVSQFEEKYHFPILN